MNIQFRSFTDSDHLLIQIIQIIHWFRSFADSDNSLIQLIRWFRSFADSDHLLIQIICWFRSFTNSDHLLIQIIHWFRSFAYSDNSLIQVIRWYTAFILGSEICTDPGRWSAGWIVSRSSSLHWRSSVCGPCDHCLCFELIRKRPRLVRLGRRKVTWLPPLAVLSASHRPTQRHSTRRSAHLANEAENKLCIAITHIMKYIVACVGSTSE